MNALVEAARAAAEAIALAEGSQSSEMMAGGKDPPREAPTRTREPERPVRKGAVSQGGRGQRTIKRTKEMNFGAGECRLIF